MNRRPQILLDECVPRTLKRELSGWDVHSVRDVGWASMLDGELLRAADTQFDVFVTVDRRLVHQQNLSGLSIALIVLVARRNSLPALQPLVPELKEVLTTIRASQIVFVPSPDAGD